MIIYTGPEGLSKSEASSCGEGAALERGDRGTLLPADVQMPPEAQPRGRKGGTCGTNTGLQVLEGLSRSPW